jgi:hypothetical protein
VRQNLKGVASAEEGGDVNVGGKKKEVRGGMNCLTATPLVRQILNLLQKSFLFENFILVVGREDDDSASVAP